MSCTDEASRASSGRSSCRRLPDEVWESLPALLGDDVELAAEPGGRLRADGPRVSGSAWSTRSTRRTGSRSGGSRSTATTPRRSSRSSSTGSAVGTLLRVRETRFDAATVVERAAARSACPRTRLTASSPRSSDPTRCRVVERLGLAPATAGEIAAQLPVSRQAVVKHLAVLEVGGPGGGHARRPAGRVPAHTRRVRGAARWMGDVGAAWDRRLAALAARSTSSPSSGRRIRVRPLATVRSRSSGGRHGLQGRRRLRQV